MIPTCPQHNIPLKPSEKGGGFYCPRPHGMDPATGKKVWFRVKDAAASTPAATGTTIQTTPQTSTNGSRAEFLACLDFAIRAGARNEGWTAEDVLAFAKKVYESLP